MKRRLSTLACLLMSIGFSFAALYAANALATDLDIAQQPLLIKNQGNAVSMVMLDNSASMKRLMYENNDWDLVEFDPDNTYYGIFDSSKNYEYDASIPVDSSAYAVSITPGVSGAFVESSCTPSSSDNSCWSGNFLNWLTSRRIDAARMVLVGGKVENRAGFDYLGNGSTQYKIVGHNEPLDMPTAVSYAHSSQYSPIPDNTKIALEPPAASGKPNPSDRAKLHYDPYTKIERAEGITIKTGKGSSRYNDYGEIIGFIYNNSGEVIGEFGQAEADASWKPSIYFRHKKEYGTPIVVTGAPFYDSATPGAVRIRDISSQKFKLQFRTWDNRTSPTETVPFLLIKKGVHTLPGGLKLVAGKKETGKAYYTRCDGSSEGSFTSVTFPSSFSSTPVVIATVITNKNNHDTVAVRIKDVTTSGFKMALETRENDNLGKNETVAYVAIEPGQIKDISFPFYLDAGTVTQVTDNDKNFSFHSGAGFPIAPVLLTTLNSVNDADTVALRTKSVTATGASLFAEEEQSCDSETTHAGETAGYLALAGSPFNVAVVVSTPPEGILHQVKDQVRLGVSFYRYHSDDNCEPIDEPPCNIYDQDWDPLDGGTLKFKIPKNPFVAKPQENNTKLPTNERGYRELTGYVGAPIDELVDAIEHYPLVNGTTPIGENLWEVIQYFEQDTPHYDPGDFDKADASHPERDPYYSPSAQSQQCTRVHVLILTDGEPADDTNIPLSDYDGDGNAYRMDDVAYWAYCDTSKGSCLDPTTGKASTPSRDLRSDIDGNQYLQIDTIGFSGGTLANILQKTADKAGGTAYAAEDGLALAQAMQSVFSNIVRGTLATVALDSTSLRSGSKLYLGRFDSSDWSGELLAFQINSDGSLAHTTDGDGLMIPDSNGWRASIPSPAARIIVSHDGGSGIPFAWSNLSATQQAALASEPVLDYLRGEQGGEAQNGGSFRNRSSLLGDVVHSAPIHVGAPAAPYPDEMEGSSHRYSSFKSTYASRDAMIYIGANDGMLHAFDATTGVERFAYVPNAVYGNLKELSNPAYIHHYTVDGTPTVADAFFDGAWHTVLVGGLRGGGQGVYALDVTDPGDWNSEADGATRVLWEFTDAKDPGLGYTFSRPNVVRLHNGEWAAVFGNGYNNTEADGRASGDGNAILYLVRLSDGRLIRKIDTGVGISDAASGGKPNGLATVMPVDADGDAVTDSVYGGDLYGNLWKFDLTGSNPSQWDVAYKNGAMAEPLFTACSGTPCTADNRQPITTRPQVARHPNGNGYLVYFGTGKFFENSDNTSTGQLTQTLYGIWDKEEDSLSSFDRSQLKQRKILAETSGFGFDLRLTSGIDDTAANGGGSIDWDTQRGWYMDLLNTQDDNTDNRGERVIAEPVLRGDRIIFTTMLLTSTDVCNPSGSGWLMELDAEQGTRPLGTLFDLNNDGAFGEEDNVQAPWDTNGDGTIDSDDKIPVSGIKSRVGIPSAPGIISMESGTKEKKFIAGSSGNIDELTEKGSDLKTGRLSWKEILLP